MSKDPKVKIEWHASSASGFERRDSHTRLTGIVGPIPPGPVGMALLYLGMVFCVIGTIVSWAYLFSQIIK